MVSNQTINLKNESLCRSSNQPDNYAENGGVLCDGGRCGIDDLTGTWQAFCEIVNLTPYLYAEIRFPPVQITKSMKTIENTQGLSHPKG